MGGFFLQVVFSEKEEEGPSEAREEREAGELCRVGGGGVGGFRSRGVCRFSRWGVIVEQEQDCLGVAGDVECLSFVVLVSEL